MWGGWVRGLDGSFFDIKNRGRNSHAKRVFKQITIGWVRNRFLQNNNLLMYCSKRKFLFTRIHGGGVVSFRTVGDFSQQQMILSPQAQ
jgi:hypothetical protein